MRRRSCLPSSVGSRKVSSSSREASVVSMVCSRRKRAKVAICYGLKSVREVGQ